MDQGKICETRRIDRNNGPKKQKESGYSGQYRFRNFHHGEREERLHVKSNLDIIVIP